LTGEKGVTAAQLLEALAKLPPDSVVLMESDGGLSLVASLEFVPAQGQGALLGAPAEIILLPSMAE
jgi:hypothetical protein